MSSVPLTETRSGQQVSIDRITGDGAFRRRLMEIGLRPGARVNIFKVAPLGDPIDIKIGTQFFSIRRDEARHILVFPSGDVPS